MFDDPAILNDLQYELRSIAQLNFVHSVSEIEQWRNIAYLTIEFFIEKPSNGFVEGIESIEPVWIFLYNNYPNKCPGVFVRIDFPYVPHLSVINLPNSLRIKNICLSRIPLQDWWVGKTLTDLVLTIKDWLDDAASGNLVKPDDPFEPLIADSSLPVIELDVERAKAECLKYNGLWITKSRKIDIGETNTARFIVGNGEIETLVWYQKDEQATPWIKQPDNLDELVTLMSSVGFERQRFLYWTNKGITKGSSFIKLIIVGIRRPRLVMGRPDSDEWIGFALVWGAGSIMCKVTTHLVHESFTRELSRKLSGYTDVSAVKKILLIGAGALGSAISELLMRSGHITIRIIDNDRLQPHNLARHVLSQDCVGMMKSTALSKRFKDLYCFEESVSEKKTDDILSLSNDQFISLTKDIDMIVDCSASVAVLKYLSDIKNLYKPVLSVYQVNQGLGTVILYTPRISDIPLDAIELTAISKWRDLSGIRKWLTEAVNSVEIGGGCRSASQTISFARVMFGASLTSNLLLEWISTNQFPEYGRTDFFNIPPHLEKEAYRSIDEIIFVQQIVGNWRIVLLESVSEHLKLLAKENPHNETGGILLGHIDRQKKIINVIDFVECIGIQNPTEYYRFPNKLKYKLSQIEKETKGLLHYVGEWHSHPSYSPCFPSETDKATMKELVNLLIIDRLPALCVISNGEDVTFHVMEPLMEKTNET